MNRGKDREKTGGKKIKGAIEPVQWQKLPPPPNNNQKAKRTRQKETLVPKPVKCPSSQSMPLNRLLRRQQQFHWQWQLELGQWQELAVWISLLFWRAGPSWCRHCSSELAPHCRGKEAVLLSTRNSSPCPQSWLVGCRQIFMEFAQGQFRIGKCGFLETCAKQGAQREKMVSALAWRSTSLSSPARTAREREGDLVWVLPSLLKGPWANHLPGPGS